MKIQGQKVRVTHLRWAEPRIDQKEDGTLIASVPIEQLTVGKLRELGYEPEPRGGRTVVSIMADDDTPIITQSAECSNGDNYSRRTGREIALGRALKAVGGRLPGEKIGHPDIPEPEPAPEFAYEGDDGEVHTMPLGPADPPKVADHRPVA